MEFLLAFLLSFDENGRSFPHNDLDDRFAYFAFSLCCFFTFYVYDTARCCAPSCVVHVILPSISLWLFVTPMHLQYMFPLASHADSFS